MTNNKANKSKILALILGLTACLAIMLGIVFASPTSTVYAAGEDGTAPTIIRTGGIDVDRKTHMGKLPNALKGVEYKAKDGSNYKIEATGTEPFTFRANKSGEGYAPLPEGLSLNPTTGEIEGTPTGAAGPYNISVTVTNKYGSDNIFVAMYVYGETSKPKITTTQADIKVGYKNSSYSQRIFYDSGIGEPSDASITNGNLPTGLRLRQAGFGIYIEGTPTEARTFTFTVRLQNAAGFDEEQYTIEVKDEIVAPEIQMQMTVINDSYSKVNEYGQLAIVKGKEVDVQFYATGTNTPDNPIKWSCNTSVLPAGLILSESGHLTGIVAESVELPDYGYKLFYIGLKATNVSSGVEQSNTSSAPLVVYKNGKITGVTISPENTSVPKGGQRQFTATVIGHGDFDKSVTWNVYYHSSKDTKISQDGVLTVGIDETSTTIGVEAKSKGNTDKILEISISIIDHMHSITLVPETQKTCTTDGNKEHFKCNDCGDLFKDAGGVNLLTEEQVKIPAGHEYGDLVPKQEPTCTQTGMRAHYKCSVCNKYFDESKNEKTEAELTISIDPNAHDFGAWIEEVPATCVVTGTKGHKDCNRCNKHYDKSGNEITDLTISINPNAHDFGAWKDEVPATCVATGTKGYKDCSRCNKHYDKSGNEITDLTIHTNDNHDWNAWVSNGDGTHTRTCKRDSGHKENGTCSGGTATCTKKAVCEVCKTTYGGFALHNTTKYNGKDSSGHWDTCSTCDNKFNFEAHTPDREKADETNPVKCTKCGFEITPAGHYEHTADSKWHNSADGKYHYHKCTHSGCSEILDKAEHFGGTATCENKAVCSVCGLEYGDKLGHDYGKVKYTWTSDNTCKAERVCKHDSTHIESETVTATGTTITEATCKEKGKMKYTATFVNTAFAMQEKEVDIDFAPHAFGKWQDEIPATCIAGGMKAHYKCTVCGKYFDENKNETTEEALKTPVSPYYGHNFGFWVEEEYATCQAPGRKGYKHCSICNKNYDASNTEITDFVIPVNPDGHELGDLVAEVPATCKDTGVKEHRDCRLCGKHCDPITRKEIADLTIPTTNNHTYGKLIPEVPATTTEFGVKEHKDCSVCGKHFDKDGNEITELRIAKIGTHNVIVNGESKFYVHGESVTVTAEYKEGKEFKGWKDENGEIVSTEKSYKFTVSEEKTLTAVYEDKSSGGGEITPPAKKDGLSGGQIAGIVIGSVLLAGIGGFAVLWFAVKKKTFADLIAAIKALFTKKK